MKNFDALAEEEVRIDTKLLGDLKQLGITNSQYEFSRLCGMTPSYYSTMKCKGVGVGIGRLVFLWVTLSNMCGEATDPRVGAVFKQAAGIVRSAITRKCELKRLRRTSQVSERR